MITHVDPNDQGSYRRVRSEPGIIQMNEWAWVTYVVDLAAGEVRFYKNGAAVGAVTEGAFNASSYDPEASLQEKISTLRWVFTEPEKDHRPFSFASCLRVVGCSPLSPITYCGAVDCEAIREHIACNAGRWLHETLARYPRWVTDALAHNPEWVDAQLSRNPQWINEEIKKHTVQGDLFA